MKKIPTLFKRKYENHKVAGITDEITPGCEGEYESIMEQFSGRRQT